MNSVDEARKVPNAIGAAISIRLNNDLFYLFDKSSGNTVLQANFTETKST